MCVGGHVGVGGHVCVWNGWVWVGMCVCGMDGCG